MGEACVRGYGCYDKRLSSGRAGTDQDHFCQDTGAQSDGSACRAGDLHRIEMGQDLRLKLKRVKTLPPNVPWSSASTGGYTPGTVVLRRAGIKAIRPHPVAAKPSPECDKIECAF